MRDDLGYRNFQKTVERLIGVDLDQYRPNQMLRRLEALIARVGARSFLEYARMIERDPARLQEFCDYFTINVTEFFRDADRFKQLETRVLPELLAGRSSLRVWSAACSTGAEPYSVAILLKELAPRGAHRILATDVDRTILARARRGDGYTRADLRNVTPARLARNFVAGPDGTHAIRPELKAMVELRQHNLLGPAPSHGFDLILCRNVVIYFTDEAKAALYQGFMRALRPNGVLFVGGTEIVNNAQQFSLAPIAPSFYRKEEPAPARVPTFRLAAAPA
jgi:chemotaxis protein methyltransferase CheR